METWLSVLIAGIFLSVAVKLLSRTRQWAEKLPPGPSGLPWIGQALQIPMLHSHLYYTQLHKLYGNIYTLTALGQKIIIINDYSTALELLAKHGAIHCNRPPNPYMTRFLGLKNVIVMMNANEDWKEGRRLYQMVFNKESSRKNYSKRVAIQARSYVLHGIENVQDKDNRLRVCLFGSHPICISKHRSPSLVG
ncbi:cytochrome P450 [Clavulina sp. PMI_390]|nr:cytochrome P450 [Clavulina sp. PMI_390]